MDQILLRHLTISLKSSLTYKQNKEKEMNQASEYLLKTKNQVLSTVGLDGKPKVRPFQFMIEDKGKMYFCTSNKKEVFRELQVSNNVELCASAEDMSWLRVSGKVAFVNELRLKDMVMEASPLVKSIYKTPENPDFEVFYLYEATAVYADFSGKPPRSIEV